jgi:error-prone DNA polymerase
MGWTNPPVPWAELARVLAGRPPQPGESRRMIRSEELGSKEQERFPRPPPIDLPNPDMPVVPYTELHCHSAFSFLDGASIAEHLVAEALRLRLSGLAITDHDGFYGVVRFCEAARETGLKTVYGAELSLGLPEPQLGIPDPVGEHLLVIARGQEGYRRLSRQISKAQLDGGKKGRPVYDLDRLADAGDGHWVILTGCRKGSTRRALARGGPGAARREIVALVDRFGRDNVVVELTRHLIATDDDDNDALAALAGELGLPVVATTGAHYADPEAARRAAAMAAVRARRSLAEADPYLPAGPGAHLRSGAEMAQLFRPYPSAVPTAAALGEECAFDLRLVAPDLPPYDVPEGHDEHSYLRELTMIGARDRYGEPADNPRAYAQLEKELDIISRLNFPGYFLVVRNITDFCHEHDIMCQGRGSAANSAVCYALKITNVDPVRWDLLFERFLAPEREGAPDIDVDIESDRREEVIQHVYQKYSRHYAALVANVNTYRPRMAVRDMAKALGHSPGQQDAYSKQLDGWTPLIDQAAQAEGGNADGVILGIPADVLALAGEIQDFPRHLSIHSGGMVICDRPIAEVCPVEWARMEDRTVLQWDKDDCARIGLVKFDLLGLGMLSALHYARDLVKEHEGIDIDFATLDLADTSVYEMLQRADSVGVFQVESRAQMATLPRLKPETFYDLVVEVALIRPGPIQGGSVHPYIRRRQGLEEWHFEHEAMRKALERTKGIPLFQEQLMELAIDVAGFNPSEADQLRRAMGSKRSTIEMEKLRDRLYAGMLKNKITGPLADSIYERMAAFANFGFAESHALSFAALVFYSAYLKLYHPAAFCAALLRAQPMGFYSPQSLISDARRHGVTVRRPDLNASAVYSGLEPGSDGAGPDGDGPNGDGPVKPAVRLGLSEVRGIAVELAERIVIARPPGGFANLESLTSSVTLTSAQAEALATAGALDCLTVDRLTPAAQSPGAGRMAGSGDVADRRAALWAAGAAAGLRSGMLPGSLVGMDAPTLPGMSDVELTIADVWATGMSPDAYPTEFTRARMDEFGVVTAAGLYDIDHGTRVLVAGMVTHRQRPATASGIIFVNLEDETGMINVICSVGLWSRYRQVARGAPSLLIRGMVERDGGAISIVADRIAVIDMVLAMPSRDFR